MSEFAEIKQLLSEQSLEIKAIGTKLDCQEKKVTKILFAIYGDNEAQLGGIAKIVSDHEKCIEQYKNDRAKIIGGTITISAIFTIITVWILNWIKQIFK